MTEDRKLGTLCHSPVPACLPVLTVSSSRLCRADLGRCVGEASKPSLAFPLGPPTALLASIHASLHTSSSPKESTRPADTLQPIQTALRLEAGVELESAVSFERVEARVQRLLPGETLLIAWQHDFIPMLVNSLRPPAPKLLTTFPLQCNSSHYREPAYTLSDPSGSCYDVLWQVVLQRPQPRPGEVPKPWHAASFNQLHQGFAGEDVDSTECREALAPMASSSALFRGLAQAHREQALATPAAPGGVRLASRGVRAEAWSWPWSRTRSDDARDRPGARRAQR